MQTGRQKSRTFSQKRLLMSTSSIQLLQQLTQTSNQSNRRMQAMNQASRACKATKQMTQHILHRKQKQMQPCNQQTVARIKQWRVLKVEMLTKSKRLPH